MNSFAIITDSSSDMTRELRERFGLDGYIRGVIYMPDGSQKSVDMDWELMNPKDYYESMKGRKILYKTATPPIGDIIDVFEPLLKEGRDILCITLSTGISGTFDVVKNVAKELLENYPERKIICVDSLRYSSAMIPLVICANKMRSEGASIEDTAEKLSEMRHTIHQMGPLDDLFFCVKTGRVTNFQAFFGTLIGVNSLADFSVDGLAAVTGKTKGRRAAFDATLEYIEKTIKDPEGQVIIVGHSNREEAAQELASRIRERFNPKDIIINPVGMSCGSSIGPGLCVAYYLGEPICDDGTNGRRLFENIIKNRK